MDQAEAGHRESQDCSPREEDRSGNQVDREGTNPEEDSPCRKEGVRLYQPNPEADLEAGRERTCWGSESRRVRLEDLGGIEDRRERVLRESGPGRSECQCPVTGQRCK